MGNLGLARRIPQVSNEMTIQRLGSTVGIANALAQTDTTSEECIAQYTKRPLMVLTSSDIGTDPSAIELNLTSHFKTATSWGAVLLIDEADVFMERRSTADLGRNSLVAGK